MEAFQAALNDLLDSNDIDTIHEDLRSKEPEKGTLNRPSEERNELILSEKTETDKNIESLREELKNKDEVIRSMEAMQMTFNKLLDGCIMQYDEWNAFIEHQKEEANEVADANEREDFLSLKSE